MALSKLIKPGLEEAGKEIAENAVTKGAKKFAKDAGESTLSKISKKIPVSYTTDFPYDFARVPVRIGAKNVNSGLAEQASKLGLKKNSAGKWVMDTNLWKTDEDINALKSFMKPILGEETPSYSRFLEQIGEGDYRMSHRPGYINDEIGDMEYAPLNNIEGSGTIFPKAYGADRNETINNLVRGYGGSSAEHRRAAEIIADAQGQPEKMVTIYRQSPKDFNYGDWVALTPEYANLHEGNSELNKLFKKEVPASEVVFAGDDINEWGWFPREVQLDDALGAEVDKAIAGAKQAGYLGEPMHLYHQTSASSLGDMTVDKRGAINGDIGVPEGIMLKATDRDIGLAGHNQLPLDADVFNPITFEDREALRKYVSERSPRYQQLLKNEADINDRYQKMFDEREKAYSDAYKLYYYNKTPENEALFKQAEKDWQAVHPEWNKAINENATEGRELIRDLLVNEGYDGMVMKMDKGSDGRYTDAVTVWDKNQLKPRYPANIQFDPRDAQSIFEHATKKQAEFKQQLEDIANSMSFMGKKFSVLADKNKSVDSMLNKVARKQEAGRDYRLMDMKDHVRGAFMVDDLTNTDDLMALFENLEYKIGRYIQAEDMKTDWGYNGIHLTWRDEDGLGYELQISTPEVWKTKKASDKIYHKWRNVTTAELEKDPKKMLQYMNDMRESQSMWAETWKKLGFKDGKPDFSWVEGYFDDDYDY